MRRYLFVLLWVLCSLHPFRHVNAQVITPAQRCILDNARKIVGLREAPGTNNRGPQIDPIIKAAGGRPGQPWCGWFSRFVIAVKCGHSAPKDGMAASWFIKSKLVTSPVPADVFSVWNKYINRIGHVGIVELVHPDGKFIVTIEGNTNGFGSREGSGVCRLTRPRKQIFNFARWWR